MGLRPGELRGALRFISRALIYSAPRECQRCPACGSTRLYNLDLLPLRQAVNGSRTGFVSGCDECGLVFSNPQPTPEEQAQFYSPDGAWGSPRHIATRDIPGEDKDHGTETAQLGRSWSRPFDPIREELSVTAPPPGAKVLDFGCGEGKLLDALQGCGWQTWGIDSAVDTAFARHHRLDVIPTEPTFDLIVVNHVLEHVTDPLGLLNALAGACRVGGFLLVGVPRFDTLPIHRDYKYVINGRAHVTAYTWPCLQGLLARSGWRSIAPPPDRMSKGRAGNTAARMRVIARRVIEGVEPLSSPAHAARAAINRYHADLRGRSLWERLGWHRLAARRAESHRRRAVRFRKKWGRDSSPRPPLHHDRDALNP